jgi:hypothetical protein
MRASRPVAAFAAALVAAACGGDGINPPVDGGTVDGGNIDAPTCGVGVQFTPVAPVAPVVVVAEASIVDGIGVLDVRWTLRRGGADVAFTTLDLGGRRIQFDAPVGGVYEVVAMVAGCSPSRTDLNVGTSGANTRPVRMRFVPPAGVPVPPQERVVTVPGGSDYSLGVVALDPGAVATVAVRTSGGAPLAAYLRISSRATPDAVVEAWSGAAGSAQVRLAAGHHDVLVVPEGGGLAPALVADWDPASAALAIAPGATWSGAVLDAGGAPIVGARVSLVSAGVPSTIATTDATGRFDLGWRDGAGPERVTVVPPPGRGLPRLDFDAAVPVAAGSTTIRFAAVSAQALGGVQVLVNGAPAADADVSIALTVPAAATIERPAAPSLVVAGGQRLVLHTAVDGRLPAATAIAGTGALHVTTATTSARASLDLTAGVGSTIAAAPAVIVTGRVLDAAGAAVVGASLRAELDDALAYTGAPASTANTDGAGAFTLALAPAQRYALSIVDPTARRAALRTTLERTTAGALPPFVLGKALRVTGELRATGLGAPLRAVGVAALCQQGCAGLERDRPLGVAVTDAAGRFAVAVPDPGVMQ